VRHAWTLGATLALVAAPCLAQAVDVPAGAPASADKAAMDEQKAMGGMGIHANRVYTYNLLQADYARDGRHDATNWDGQGWVGGDRGKFWYKTQGETRDNHVERGEFQALYSRNLWTFFDAQGGIRYDISPDRRGYAVIGIQGLAPYLFSTELHAFIGFKGDVSVRAKGSFDLLMTNRFIVTPSIETDVYLNDARERRVGSGVSRIETGVQARYELSRKFAPYVAAIYEDRFGRTARFYREAGDSPGGWQGRVGVRLWF